MMWSPPRVYGQGRAARCDADHSAALRISPCRGDLLVRRAPYSSLIRRSVGLVSNANDPAEGGMPSSPGAGCATPMARIARRPPASLDSS